MNDWYYAIGRQQQGPVTREALLQLIQTGQVRPQDLVWNSTLTNWVPATDAPGLLKQGSAAPSTPAAAIGSTSTPASAWPPPAAQTGGSFNPYSSPGPSAAIATAPPVQGGQWEGHIKAVSIILIVYGGLNALGSLVCGGFFGAVATGLVDMDGPNQQPDARVIGSVYAAIGAIGLLMSGFVIFAGTQCLKRRGRGVGIAACIMCILGCNILGMGAGIYGLVILCNQDVARLFEKTSSA